MKMLKIFAALLAALAAIISLCSCKGIGQYVEPTPVAVAEASDMPTANPFVSPIPTQAPTPAPTEEPTPTPNPFLRYAPTINMSFKELIGDNGNYDLPKGYPAPDTYKIIVDECHQVTMVFSKDAEGNYTVPVRYMLCSTGANGCTPKGNFSMGAYRVRFSLFKRDGRFGQYWTQVFGAIYFHTTLYLAKDASSYETASYDLLGNMDSHGCIRLTVPDARWMWYNIAAGTSCVIRRGDPNDAETAAIRAQLILADSIEGLDIEPGEIPYTDNWRIEDVPLEVPFVQGSQN